MTKLSEDLMLGRHCIEEMMAGDTQKCAIGAALLSRGIKPIGQFLDENAHPLRGHDYLNFECLYPWVSNYDTRCPKCSKELYGPAVVWHVFDSHVMTPLKPLDAMTYEQMVDWIASIEPQDGLPTAADLDAVAEEERVKEATCRHS